MSPGLKTRLTLWHAAGVALLLAIIGVAADWWLTRTIETQVDAALVSLAETEAASALDVGDGGQPTVHLHDLMSDAGAPALRRLDKLAQITDAEGRVIASSGTLGGTALPVPPALLARLARGEVVIETLADFGGEPLRVVALPIAVEGRFRYGLQVATSLRPARAFLATARLMFAAASIAILAGVALTGGVLADRVLRHIDRITARARSIGESTLAARLPSPGTDDEIARLVTTLNDMLARLERSFEVQRRFTADASHELRSPLSRLRSELEVALRRPRTREEYETVLRSSLEEAERLARLTEDLLTLARLDAGEGREAPTRPTPVSEVVDETLGRLGPSAERRKVSLAHHASQPASVGVAPGLLSLAVGNLVANAIKYSPPGGRVTVTTSREDGAAVIAVADGGPGIAPDEAARVFDRFFRGRAAAPDAPGVGLGLAIVKAVVDAHGGSVTVDAAAGAGATFRLRLPLVA